ncbi:MAG: hypothetical protein CVV49_10265 [Spirochaetae bacterium HGW-Spirochaetae-5]|nr:MAG: hypothetical protein CVV49_10265 [Spirochaetae bacterium HGW-Spirochaetae-5]
MGADDKKELKALKCAKCGGDLVKGSRSHYDDEEEETVTIPVARCIQCNTEYDQHTSEYYEVFADDLTYDKDSTVFKLGLKGKLKGIEYEIIGRLRYQEEEEYEKSTWDEWVAVSEDGVFHYFVEEDGRIDSYEEYIPESIDMESSGSSIEFEGKKIKKSEGYIGRIVLAEGELPWTPEIGEATLCYDFKKDGLNYTIEKTDDEVSITKGEKLSHGEIIDAFNIGGYKDLYANTLKKRKSFRWESRIYLAAMLFCLILSAYSCLGDKPVPGVMNSKSIFMNNSPVNDAEGSVYESQILYGPFDIPEGDKLYNVSVQVNQQVEPLNLEWLSFRFMLVGESRLNDLSEGKINDSALLGDIFENIDALPEPLESYVIIGDFWDEEGRDSDGYWHESDLSYDTDFVLDDAGKYYVYLELFSNNKKDVNSVVFAISQSKGYRYYIVIFFVFFILWGVSKIRSRSYNELPFEMSE